MIKKIFLNKYIRRSKIDDVLSKTAKKVRHETWREYEQKIADIEREHKNQILLLTSELENDNELLRQKLSNISYRENSVKIKESELIEKQTELIRASQILQTNFERVGQIVSKSAAECRGVFERVERLIKK